MIGFLFLCSNGVCAEAKDTFRTLDAGQFFPGWLGVQTATCYEGRMMKQPIPELIEPFTKRTEKKVWQSEFWGKWFTLAVLAYKYRPTPELKKRPGSLARHSCY